MKKKLLYLVNDLEYFLSHRFDIALAAKQKGYEVYVYYGTLRRGDPSRLTDQNIKVKSFFINRRKKNLFLDFLTFSNLFFITLLLRPKIIHLISIKPYLYGGIIARLLRIHGVVSSVSGLGNALSVENTKKFTTWVFLKPIFTFAFNNKNQFIIVQNKSDQQFLVNWLQIRPEKVVMTNGSGVNVKKIFVAAEANKTPTISLAARLIYDKGIREFVQVARAFTRRKIKANFWIIGEVDHGNPMSISEKDLREWSREPNVTFLGYQEDVINLYLKSSIVCLPSYYGEGMPKSLLEAAACGRPIVTTDLPGCRDTIIPGTTGLLVPPRDASELERALEILVLNPDTRRQYGEASRLHAEKHFNVEKVIDTHLNIYQRLCVNEF